MADVPSVKALNKVTSFSANLTTADAQTVAFVIPAEHTSMLLQVGVQATAQTIWLQGSMTGATGDTGWVDIVSQVSGSSASYKPLTRSTVGYYPYYRLKNKTGSPLAVACSVSSNVAFV